jgi:DDE superfamily endonuclease
MPYADPIRAMLAPFRPLFTAPTWKKMMTLLRGTLLARGRRTVTATAALWPTGQQQDPHFSAFHQVLTRACWSPLAASRHLLTRISETCVQAGGTLDSVIDETLDSVIDETLERRWGAQIRQRGQYRESALSSPKRSVRSPGLRSPRAGGGGYRPVDAPALGAAVSGRPGHSPGGEPATGPAPQNARDAGTPTGPPAPPRAARGADQADGRLGRQYAGTGTPRPSAADHPACPVAPRRGAPPATSRAQHASLGASPCRGQTTALDPPPRAGSADGVAAPHPGLVWGRPTPAGVL